MKKTKAIFILACLGITLNGFAQDPYLKANNSYISLSGTVTSSGAESFILDYGEGLVTVEMDDWDWYGEAYSLLPDDEVVVYGFVDDDFFETTTIEASSVYVKDLNTYFYASGADEESNGFIPTTFYDFDFSVTGKVSAVNGREFTVDTGTRKINVDTWQLGYDPLDDQGFLKVKTGDRVTVQGDMDRDLFGKNEISAEAIVKLQSDKRSTDSSSRN